jgi:N-acetyl-beta-hexosaminidase
VIAANDANAALDPSNEQTFDVLAKLMTELAGIFPDTYFHLGGECGVHEVLHKLVPPCDCSRFCQQHVISD